MLELIPLSPPPPPPPPPPGPPHFVIAMLGQSNMVNLCNGAGGAAMLARIAELVPGSTAEFVNTAHGSSYMAQGDPPIQVWWQPDGTLLPAAVAEYNAAVVAAIQAHPGSTLKKIAIYYQGEAESRDVRGDETLHWPKGMRTVVDYFRTNVGEPGLPFIVTEMHAQPSGAPGPDAGAFPLWPYVQWMQRQCCNPTEPFTFIPGCTLVSAADQNASGDGGLHLASSALVTLGTRYAEAVVSVLP